MLQVHVVVGPPGTGKTTYIARQVEHAVTKYGPEKVLVCSLTRTSAREASRAVILPDSQVGTLHSFAYRALGHPELTEGHMKEWNDLHPHWAIGHAGKIDEPYGYGQHTPEELTAQKTGDELALLLARYRTTGIASEEWPGDVRAFGRAWADWKAQCDYMDFTDLIHAARDVERAPGDPAVIALDEQQDFGQAEMTLVQQWAQHAEHLILVGDRHQALFCWRGGGMTRSIPCDTYRVLEQSWRVPRAVHQVAMRWMRRTKIPTVTYHPRDVEGSVTYGSAPYKVGPLLSTMLIPQLAELLQAEKEVMLLTTCRYMLDPILQALRHAGIAYHNPWRPHNGAWNPLASRKGASNFAERVLAFLRPSQTLWGGEARFWTVADLKAWAKALPTQGVFLPGKRAQVERCQVTTTDVELAHKLREWFTPDALTRILDLDVGWYLEHAEGGGTVKPLVTAMVQHYGAACLATKPQVIVGTVHSLKGSEAQVVMLWPDISPASAYGGKHEREEMAKVFYVGVTRAKEDVILMPPSSQMAVPW